MTTNAELRTLRLYTTASYPCSYLPNQSARSEVATPDHLIDAHAYSQLMRLGFRRSGSFVYRPHCPHCQACQSLRIPVAAFTPNRSQRRAWRQHQQLQARVLALSFHPEHYALYQTYQRARHSQGGMDCDSVEQYSQFLLHSRVESRLVEFRTPGDEGALCMVSLIDLLDDGISAVYTFYAPEPKASYGTYGILWLIALAQQLGLPYVYLGYWIENSSKMLYKQDFEPHEILRNGIWQEHSRTHPANAGLQG